MDANFFGSKSGPAVTLCCAVTITPSSPLHAFVQAVQADGHRHALEFELANCPMVSSTAATGGANAPIKMILENGWTAYFKAFSQVNFGVAAQYGHVDRMPPLLEAVAWKLAERIGPPVVEVVQPVVLREMDPGTGTMELGALSLGAYGVPNYAPILDSEPAVRLCSLFDCLVGQQDRHTGNFKFESAQYRLALFDHGFAFARPGDHCNSTAFVQAAHAKGWADLDGWQTDALAQLVGSPDTLGIAPMLPDDRHDALRARAEAMLNTAQLLPAGQF